MTLKAHVLRPLPGYLYTLPGRLPGGRSRPILLKVACPCGRWHTHGAGTTDDPHDLPAGTDTARVGHCLTHNYRRITVQAEPFRTTWATPLGRISATYLRHAGRVAERVGSV